MLKQLGTVANKRMKSDEVSEIMAGVKSMLLWVLCLQMFLKTQIEFCSLNMGFALCLIKLLNKLLRLLLKPFHCHAQIGTAEGKVRLSLHSHSCTTGHHASNWFFLRWWIDCFCITFFAPSSKYNKKRRRETEKNPITSNCSLNQMFENLSWRPAVLPTKYFFSQHPRPVFFGRASDSWRPPRFLRRVLSSFGQGQNSRGANKSCCSDST